MQDSVTLIVPAKLSELSVVRLTTAGIASRFQMDWETMEDIKTAVYEACYAMSVQRWAWESLKLDFSLKENFSVTITGQGEKRETDGKVPEEKLCRAVLEAMIPSVSIDISADTICSVTLSR